ncbi:MAG: response regulator [Deltaproteobacteria bacterium]|nr:response regulator [Deltaproteobacteria bacterium]
MMLDGQGTEQEWLMDFGDRYEEMEPTKVLLAEDDDELRELIAVALRREGYAVFEVDNGDQLVRYIHRMQGGVEPEEDIDLVISDVCLPGRSGLEALERLRERDGSLPVILMTAFPTPEVREAVERAGTAVLFDKPFQIEDLCTAANYFAASH